MSVFFLALYGAVMVWVWIAAAFRIRDLRRDPSNRPLRALMHVAVAFGLALALMMIAPLADAIHGVEGLTSTVWHVLTCWAATQFGVFLLASSYPPHAARPRIRRRLVAFAAAATIMVLAWLLATPADRAHGFRVIDTSPAAAAWQFAFIASLAWSLADGARLAFRYSRQADQRDLRMGLRLLGAGAVAGMAFCLSKAWTATVQVAGVGPIVPGVVLLILVATSMGLIMAGIVYPGMASRIRSIPSWLERRTLHRQLFPLWSELRTLFPRQVMGRVPSRGFVDAIQLRHLALRQYRRVVEVRDMLRELRPWYSAEVCERARRWADEHQVDDPDAYVAGVVIADAVRARRAGSIGSDDGTLLLPRGGDTLLDEARALAAITRVWQVAPVQELTRD